VDIVATTTGRTIQVDDVLGPSTRFYQIVTPRQPE
jgi:hypothetical protein